MEAGCIKAIDKGSVHRICSGQVVLTLATAVKELIENSIDAGATIVDVKLKEYGSDMVEVSDNGSGVEEKNFEGLTLKHHTSKLEDFSDLIGVETFGFRGEALSSLCALSDLNIVSRHKSVEVGTRLTYDHHGRLSSKTPMARQVGTTVTLQNIFYTLPVRYKEFQRNLKKEFVKMVQVLNAYCLINTGVRISCSNQTAKGNRSTVVSSKGNPTMKENISNIFGPKQLQSLLEVKQSKPSEEVSAEYGVKCEGNDIFRLEGYISKCEHGQGRSSGDRQFYFINKRPCDHSKISKLVNEVYHQYNRHQYPFVVLSINMCKESVDVNVTPDKRQIFIENEKILLAVIKTTLIEMFEPTSSVYNVNTLDSLGGRLVSSPSKSSLNRSLSDSCHSNIKPSIGSAFNNLKRTFSSNFSKGESSSPVTEQRNKQRKLDNFVVKSISPSKSSPRRKMDNFINESQSPIKAISSIKPDVLCVDDDPPCFNLTFETSESVIDKEPCNTHGLDIVTEEHRETSQADSGISSSQSLLTISSDEVQQFPKQEVISHHSNEEIIKEHLSDHIVFDQDSKWDGSSGVHIERNVDNNNLHKYRLCTEAKSNDSIQPLSHETPCDLDTPTCVHDSESHDTPCDLNTPSYVNISQSHDEVDRCSPKKNEFTSLKNDGTNLQITCIDEKGDHAKKERNILFNLQNIKDKAKRKNQRSEGKNFCRSFRAKISPTDNTAAEEELQKEIKKDMFKEMEILGQFNLGFIITKLKDDLFIVDQHATDEKYNFEMLQKHTVIQNQKLIHPQALELTSSNEIILMENIEVFRKNGFDFIIDEEADPTRRVKLISSPVSKNWTFGKDDIEELIFMLTDSPGVMCRPSRIRAMFASRSCRKSIMIGTALNKAEMRKLVVHMGEIEQPWNCPHGRPTMRHLINVNMVPR